MLSLEELVRCGLDAGEANALLPRLERALAAEEPTDRWRTIVGEILCPTHPAPLRELCHRLAYVDWDESRGPAPR